MLIQLITNGCITACLFAICGLGYSLIYNSTKIFHFAHAAVFVAGAYFMYYFNNILHINFFISLILSILLSILTGIVMDRIVYYPISKKTSSTAALFISSLGIYIISINLIAMLAGNEIKILRPGIEQTYKFGQIIITKIQAYQVLSFLICAGLFIYVIRRTSAGIKLRAYADNPDLAGVCGISRNKIRYLVFAVGSGLAGFSGILFALDVGIDPYSGISPLLFSAVALIIGGISIFESVILGSFILGILQSLVIWKYSARWQECIVFVVLILFLFLSPEGILGKMLKTRKV